MTGRAAIAAFAIVAAGCGGPGSGDASPSESAASEPSQSPVSVVCEWYEPGAGGPLFEEAFIASVSGEQYTVTLREAITATEELATRASGEEREDLLALVEAADQAALADDVITWADLSEAFYVKYAEECDAPLATLPSELTVDCGGSPARICEWATTAASQELPSGRAHWVIVGSRSPPQLVHVEVHACYADGRYLAVNVIGPSDLTRAQASVPYEPPIDPRCLD